jgi:hypothetical protein
MVMIATVVGLQGCSQTDSAADTAKVTTPPTTKLVEFCASETGDYQDGFCSGYLLGYAYGLDGKPASGVCVPQNVTVRQIRDTAIRYLRTTLPRSSRMHRSRSSRRCAPASPAGNRLAIYP